jgi:S-adenosylmethionine/arginine decarboxylase-like enzyme
MTCAVPGTADQGAQQEPDVARGRITSHRLSAALVTSDRLDGCTAAEFLEVARSAATRAGLTPVGQLGVDLAPAGASAVVLLTESHVTLHHWPELSRITVDIHVCDYRQSNLERAEALARLLEESLAAPGEPAVWHRQCTVG